MDKTDILYKTLEYKYPLFFKMFKYHKTHENKEIRFEEHHYLIDIYKDKKNYIVIKSCTQSGKSEYLIGKAIDKAMQKRNVLYVLPTEVLRTRFVSARFDKSVEYTKFYKDQIRDLNSTTLKSFGTGIINFIGSNSEQGFTEFKAYDIIIDELDRCNNDNLMMASRRQSSIEESLRTTTKVSNPTFLNYGIDIEYNLTDKKRYLIKCPECQQYIDLDFFKHVVNKVDNDFVLLDEDFDWSSNDIKLLCDKCNKFFYKQNFMGEWIADNKQDVNKSGYHISKLFATPVKIRELVDNFNKGLVNDIEMQRFYNDDLGLSYTSSGAKITDEMLDECIEQYNIEESSNDACICGIDVGNVLNIVIGRILESKVKIIAIKELHDEKDIYDLCQRYNIKCGVIDAMPESRMSKRIVANIKSFWRCYFNTGKKDTLDVESKIINVDRTGSLDNVKEMILTKQIILPRNAKSIVNFYDQMTASTRVYIEDKQRYDWIETGADHYMFAMNYMLIARKLLLMAR